MSDHTVDWEDSQVHTDAVPLPWQQEHHAELDAGREACASLPASSVCVCELRVSEGNAVGYITVF